MTIILPPDYHAQTILEKNRIICISEFDANRADIRSLRIGILNIMPEAQSYEYSLLHPLGRSILQIIPVWIKLNSHKYQSTLKSHLDKLYVTFDQAINEGRLDGLIITGAPVEHLKFEDIYYWSEINNIIKTSRQLIPSTLGICWGAMALAKIIGLEKTNYTKKHFGIFNTLNLDRNHRITGSLDDQFWLPQSRHSGYSNKDLEKSRDKGIINLLAKTIDYDYTIFETCDSRFIMNLGHFEYEPDRIKKEYERDKKRDDVVKPHNYDEDHQPNIWRCQRNEFYQQWLKYCHEETHLQQ